MTEADNAKREVDEAAIASALRDVFGDDKDAVWWSDYSLTPEQIRAWCSPDVGAFCPTSIAALIKLGLTPEECSKPQPDHPYDDEHSIAYLVSNGEMFTHEAFKIIRGHAPAED
jgi:hypothetical protein